MGFGCRTQPTDIIETLYSMGSLPCLFGWRISNMESSAGAFVTRDPKSAVHFIPQTAAIRPVDCARSRGLTHIELTQLMNQPARIGILTVSDRASRGEYEDRGGPAIREYLNEVLVSEWEPHAVVISDDQPEIEAALSKLADENGCCLIITTGGTGPALRDVTPEATEAVCQKMMPGFGELMRKVSLEKVPTAILSRQTAGIRGAALIVNLPGQPKAIAECLDAVFPAIPYCIDLIGGPFLETNENRIIAFRPKKKK